MAAGKKDKVKKGDSATAEEAMSDDEGVSEGAGVQPKRRLSGRTIVLFMVLPAVIIAGGVGAAVMLGVFGGDADHSEGPEGKQTATAEHAVFFDMPELLVNMSAGKENAESFLKLSLSLELPNAEATAQVQSAMPRIIDSTQIFLRELRLDDVQGSAGMLRLREELLRRINAAVAPVDVRDVLFKEIIIQ